MDDASPVTWPSPTRTKKDIYMRMIFIDVGSAFNILPQLLIGTLRLLGMNISLCIWIMDYLKGGPQSVRTGISCTTMLRTENPYGCVLSSLLFTPLSHNWVVMHSSNHIIKFAGDMIVVGLISKKDNVAKTEELQWLTDKQKLQIWCFGSQDPKEDSEDSDDSWYDHWGLSPISPRIYTLQLIMIKQLLLSSPLFSAVCCLLTDWLQSWWFLVHKIKYSYTLCVALTTI